MIFFWFASVATHDGSPGVVVVRFVPWQVRLWLRRRLSEPLRGQGVLEAGQRSVVQ